jgi:NADH dehydrogenase
MHKVVIVGGGFGGLSAISKLKKYSKNKKIELTLIDENNYSLFTPMLPEVVSGTVKPENIVFSLREITSKYKAKFICDTVINIDKEKQIVECLSNEVEYDYLIIASGSETNFRNNDSAMMNAMEFKSIKDAIDLKYRVIKLLENASSEPIKENIKKVLTFSIIGGGITGVELACELQEFIEERIKSEYTEISENDFQINIFEYASTILPGIDEKQSAKAQQILLNKGINIINNANVKIIDIDKIQYEVNSENHIIDSNTTIWTAGVKGQTFLNSLNCKLTKDNRLIINHYLKPKDCESKNIFVIGDSSAYEFKNNILPPVAPLAMQQAATAAKNIIASIQSKKPKEFSYLNFGYLVSLGKNNSVVNLFGFKFRGRFAYYLWKFTYLFKIGMFKKQVAVFFDWILSSCFGHDGTLILDDDKCVGCNTCITKCPAGILEKVNGKVVKTDASACIDCETCVAVCKHGVHNKI